MSKMMIIERYIIERKCNYQRCIAARALSNNAILADDYRCYLEPQVLTFSFVLIRSLANPSKFMEPRVLDDNHSIEALS